MRPETVGIHLFVWGARWHGGGFDLPRVLAACRALGFAGVELPWLEPVPRASVVAAARAVRAAGLWATVSTALPPEACLVDPARADAGVEWLACAAEGAAELGAPVLCGPLLAPVGELPSGPPRAADAAAEPLARACERAARAGVRLCVEPLNRYETDVLNTLAQGAALCRRTGAVVGEAAGPALLTDTYHLNIEEADPVAALRRHLRYVGHVHLSENHRGPVGSGHVPWEAVARALADGGYAGRAVVEGFNGRLPELTRATCLWCPPARSPEEFAARSAEGLRRLWT